MATPRYDPVAAVALALVTVGAAALVVGVAVLWGPWAWLAAGVLLVGLGFLVAYDNLAAPPSAPQAEPAPSGPPASYRRVTSEGQSHIEPVAPTPSVSNGR